MIKLLKLLLSISILPTILGCGLLESAIGDLLTFEAEEKTSLIIEQSYTSITNRQVSLPISLPTNFSNELKSRGATLDSFSDIVITGVQLTIQSPTGKNFDFLKDITFDVSDEVIANLEEVPENQDSIKLNTTELNLLPFIKDDLISIEMTFEFLETIPEDYTTELTFSFAIKANVL